MRPTRSRRIAGALLLLLLLGGCSAPTASQTAGPLPTTLASAESSPLTSESAAPSASPAPSATPNPSPTTGVGTLDVFLPGAAVKVVVDELNLRRKPSTSAKRIEILKRGKIMIISPSDNISLGWGPVKANGYTWYPVIDTVGSISSSGTLDPLPSYPIPIGAEPISGWVAADNGTRQYLAALDPRCPTTIDLTNVEGMLPAERLACFGDPITLTGTFGCSGCGGATVGTYKPAWLASPLDFDFLSTNPAERLGPLAVHFPPGGPARPAAGSRVTLTLHVDDSRSTKCQIVDGEGADAVTVDQATAIFYCRERLVVDSVQNLGPDPSFPTY